MVAKKKLARDLLRIGCSAHPNFLVHEEDILGIVPALTNDEVKVCLRKTTAVLSSNDLMANFFSCLRFFSDHFYYVYIFCQMM